jgi:hypothetical protein
MANKDKLYNKRYKTLAEHRAAVKARKALQGGKNVGPVANADAYGSSIKKKDKPKAKPADKKPASSSKPAAKAKPRQTTPAEAKSRFFSSSSGTYGQSLPSNPKLKSQKRTKQVSGQGGRKRTVTVKPKLQKPTKPKRNRRGRRVG